MFSGARHVDDPRRALARGGRDRDQQLVGPPVAEQVRQLVGRAEHADAVQAQVLLARVVVDEADRRVAEGGRAQHLLQHQLGGVAGADDDHLLAARDDRAALRPLDDRPREHPRAGDERQRQQQVDHPDRRAARSRGWTSKKLKTRNVTSARRDDAARSAPHVARRDVAPPAVVEAEEREDAELDRRRRARRSPSEVALVVDGQVGVEAEPEGEEPGGDDDRDVGRQLRQPVAVDRSPHARAARRRRRRRTVVDDALLHLGADPAPERQRQVLGGGLLGLRQRARAPSRGTASRAGGGAASRSTRRRRSRAPASAARDAVALGRADDVHVVDVARRRPPAARRRRRGRARRSAPPPRAGRRSSRRGAAGDAQERGLERVEPRVRPDQLERLLVARAVEAEHPDPLRDLVVGAATSPPSPSANRFLVGKKLKVEPTPVVAIPSAPNAWAASSIMRQAERGELGERRGPAEEVDGHDRLRPRGDPALDVLGIEVQRHRIDVREDRRRAGAGDRLGGRVEGERGADHLVARVRCPSPRARARARRCRSRRRSRAGRRGTRRPPPRTPAPRGRR